MPDLKDLGSAVQEQVAAPDFDGLVRRGKQRRIRRQVLAIAGTAATAALVVAIAVTPVTLSRSSDQRNPVAPAPTEKDANAMVHGPDMQLRNIVMTAADQWVAVWATCTDGPCPKAAVIHRGGRQTTTPVYRTQIIALGSRTTAEPMAIGGPDFLLTRKGPKWPMLMRLTAGGPTSEELRDVDPTSTVRPGDTLIDNDGDIRVLDIEHAALREFDLPPELGGGMRPVRDRTGRWWVLAGLGQDFGSDRTLLAWTDDGGRNWSHKVLDSSQPGAALAVSPDGRTIVVAGMADGDATEAIGAIWISRDRGRTWQTVNQHPSVLAGDPVAFDDGTVLLLGRDSNDSGSTVYQIVDRTAAKADGFPQLRSLAGTEDLLYGRVGETAIAVSGDRGRTWRTFEPR